MRRYVLYVIVPSIIVTTYSYAYILANVSPQFGLTAWGNGNAFWVYVALNVVSFALQGLAIYLAVIWSRMHNRRVDASKGI